MIKSIKHYVLILVILTFSSCEKKEASFVLNGNIKGLKKGTVYLQKDGDSSVVNLDSMLIKGESQFSLSTDLKEAQLLYLKLFKNDGEEHYVPFFADMGVMEITTSLDRFNYDANISGSKQQKVLEDYLKIMSTFNDQNLELIQKNFIAQKNQDQQAVDSLSQRSERLLRLKYASTINFALNNKDSEVAPYLALYEMPNTSIKYTDSIFSALTPKIKTSYYGRMLGDAINTYKQSQDSL